MGINEIKEKQIGAIDSEKLLGTLFSQLMFCSNKAREDGSISQENLGRILTVNSILIEHFNMSWDETKEFFSSSGLETNMIKK